MSSDKAIRRWAWHNSHLTKKISDDQRITPRESKSRSSKSGRVRRRPYRPRASLIDRVSNLHLLLRVPSFSRWPLEVRFFCEDVHMVWRTWCDRTDGEIRSDLNIILDVEQHSDPSSDSKISRTAQNRKRLRRLIPDNAGVADLDTSYNGVKNGVQKGLLLAKRETEQCVICSKRLADPALVCPQPDCDAVSHVECLAKHFRRSTATDFVLPISGNCPSCHVELRWIDLVKELSLRARGVKEMQQLYKSPRVRKTKPKCNPEPERSHVTDGCDTSTLSREECMVSSDAIDEDQLPDDWLDQCVDDSVSVTSTDSGLSSIAEALSPVTASTTMNHSKVVIEDSDWENAELID